MVSNDSTTAPEAAENVTLMRYYAEAIYNKHRNYWKVTNILKLLISEKS